jgi:hypothetical protein
MFDELLKYNSLGNKRELTFVLFFALHRDKKIREKDCIKFCNSNLFSIGKSIHGILTLLEYVGFIATANGEIRLKLDVFDPAKYTNAEEYFDSEHFYFHLAGRLVNESALFFTRSNLKIDSSTKTFYLKSGLVTFSHFPIRNLLISLGFIRYQGEHAEKLVVNSKFSRVINELVIPALEQMERAGLKDSDLSKILQKKKEAGIEGEQYVLEYEKTRLASHPFFNKICRISEENVGAGYDIVSYNDVDSLFIDRFIEVKSFQDDISFFWSKNEIATAKELGEKYFLYLVDRNKMSNPTYQPNIFQNPFEKIFVNDAWKKEAESWQIVFAL